MINFLNQSLLARNALFNKSVTNDDKEKSCIFRTTEVAKQV